MQDDFAALLASIDELPSSPQTSASHTGEGTTEAAAQAPAPGKKEPPLQAVVVSEHENTI